MSGIRLLVVEGNVKANRDRAVASGGSVSSEAYGELLRRLGPPGTMIDICYPADPGANLPDAGGLEGYDGVAITGSALNVYDGGPAIAPQIELVRTLFRTATPCFGSCWGLQVATVAAGGTVRANPDGREIGIGRRIEIAEAGHGHGLFIGKPRLFDAITVHLDEVETLAPGTTVLATNGWSPVQAAEIETPGGGGFWGTQYHPEYTFAEIAAVFRRYGDLLIRQGLFPDAAAQAAYIAELDALEADPAPKPLVWKYGLDETVLDPAVRSRELKNWIEQAVLPAKSARGRA
jgi:GMP synthase (glutamine-hydrolysing)